MSRVIAAAPEKVFDVWLDPNSAGTPWYGAERVILNAAVDGLFYFSVQYQGRPWAHDGRFRARHCGVPDDALGPRHQEGWTAILGALADRFQAAHAD